MELQVIMLNGPKYAGKTTTANSLATVRDDTIVTHLMQPVKEDALRFFMDAGHRAAAYVQEIEEKGWKDEVYSPTGLTYREMYIQYAQRLRRTDAHAVTNLWRTHSEAIRTARLETDQPLQYMLVPDVRFKHEVELIEKWFGVGNCKLVHVYREDKDFFGDVGYYVLDHRCEVYPLYNNTDVASATEQLAVIMRGGKLL